MFRRRTSPEHIENPALNPNRTADLFAFTTDGYIIAQDIACQQEFMEHQCCHFCDGRLVSVAQINRAFQGLHETVALCPNCGERHSFIFDISNEVYQEWWAARMGDAYVRAYDGRPRSAGRE
jgi:hypothetical protein